MIRGLYIFKWKSFKTIKISKKQDFAFKNKLWLHDSMLLEIPEQNVFSFKSKILLLWKEFKNMEKYKTILLIFENKTERIYFSKNFGWIIYFKIQIDLTIQISLFSVSFV